MSATNNFLSSDLGTTNLVTVNATRTNCAPEYGSNTISGPNNLPTNNGNFPALSLTFPTTEYDFNAWINFGMSDCSPITNGPDEAAMNSSPTNSQHVNNPATVFGGNTFNNVVNYNTTCGSFAGPMVQPPTHEPLGERLGPTVTAPTFYQPYSVAPTWNPAVPTAPSQLRIRPTTSGYPIIGQAYFPAAPSVPTYTSPTQDLHAPYLGPQSAATSAHGCHPFQNSDFYNPAKNASKERQA